MYQVTLLFPSYQAFRLWCRAMVITHGDHTANTLYRNDQTLGRYRPASGAQVGVLAEIAIKQQEGSTHAYAQEPAL